MSLRVYSEVYKEELRTCLPQVLPKVLPYLTSRESEGSELQSRVITVKLSLLNQHRRVDVKKLKVRRVLVWLTVTVVLIVLP